MLIEEGKKEIINSEVSFFKAQKIALENIEDDISNGYLKAAYDTIVFDEQKLHFKYDKGKPFIWEKVTLQIPDEFKLKTEEYVANKIMNSDQTKQLSLKILSELENKGYPFARTKFENISFNDNKATAHLTIIKGPLVKIDSIYIKGNADINDKWIRTYLEIQEGDLYSEKKIRDISRKIEFLSFVKEIKPSELVFSPKGADLYLYLEKVSSSNINGVVGFLPDDNNRINITGDVKLKLENTFKIGERLDLNWRKMQPQTQDLKINTKFPFLFGTAFGINGGFKLYKRDTTFLEIQSAIGLNYRINTLLQLNAMYELYSNSLLGGANDISNPEIGNSRKNTYILGLESSKLNRFINPSKGYEALTNFKFTRRTAETSQNDTTVNTTTTNYAVEIQAAAYIPLWKRNVIKIGILGEHIIAPELFSNELIRFGGLKTFRGFDEESLTASSYGIGTLEYRFLLDRYSNIFLFFDGAYYESKTINETIRDTPFGFGGGIEFTTNAGTFVLVYALGKQFNNPILIRTGKIHFGYINYF